VTVRVGERELPGGGTAERVSNVRHCAVTLVWKPLMIDVPCGAPAALTHNPTDVWSSGAAPSNVTLAAGSIHSIRTHGDGAPLTFKAHPATVLTSPCRSGGSPSTVVRTAVGDTVADPPWGHMIVAREVRTN
jgi:hypothetical protein